MTTLGDARMPSLKEKIVAEETERKALEAKLEEDKKDIKKVGVKTKGKPK